ncbi:MarC family protein [Roseococcus sp. SDR]|uniref:MarC family protein n=1 Tax=Roseococcus sp. SDR TaxID=2835532 RepID=UPI001BCB39DE|nr:MarC family protein [Roseococcus sp. SDR]MBS7789647.1 MarC family protein [Roseococcus sp. SDR]MBV1844961.1 MarC family protein [Roseococcus sp. SDR]
MSRSLPLLALLLAWPGLALAETAAPFAHAVPAKKIFALLFLMIGPLKILGPFVMMTRGADAHFRRQLATRAILFSGAALAIAGLLGQRMLQNFNIPIQVLALTGGLVLFLVALQTVLEQFKRPDTPRGEAPPPSLALAFNPLAFPTIVTPYGIAAMIIFVCLTEGDPPAQLTIAGLVLLILTMNWLAMLYAHVILKYAGTALQVFAVVLGVTQVALGLMIILQSLSGLGVFTLRV